MGIFARIERLIKANINYEIDKAENPKKMLDQLILEMSTQLAEATRNVAGVIASEKELAANLKQEADNVAEWKRRAEMAIRAGNEALACEALARRKQHETIRANYEEMHGRQKVAVDGIRNKLRQLNDKIEEAKRKKELLIAIDAQNEALKKIGAATRGLNPGGAFETFDNMEKKIRRQQHQVEAEAEVMGERNGDHLKSKFEELENSFGMASELEALKREMGIAPPPQPVQPSRVQSQSPPVGQPTGYTPAYSTSDADESELDMALDIFNNEQKQLKSQTQRRMPN